MMKWIYNAIVLICVAVLAASAMRYYDVKQHNALMSQIETAWGKAEYVIIQLYEKCIEQEKIIEKCKCREI